VLERIRVTVRPSATHPDVLTVQDAMRQVLDIFELLVTGDSEKLVWALVDATMNSPLTVEGQAVSLNAGVDVAPIARAQKARFTRSIRTLRRGSLPREWAQTDRLRAARRLMQRAAMGVGDTDIVLSEGAPPLIITPRDAGASLQILNRASETYELLDEDRSRDEYGAIEGVLLLAGFEYNQPAIKIEERTTRREVWCRVSEEERERIGQSTDFRDVWEHRRVVVRGLIRYDKSGEIIRVYAKNITRVDARRVAVERLRDPHFTGGLSVRQYIDQFREGELGG
jgi:hypothetical protein